MAVMKCVDVERRSSQHDRSTSARSAAHSSVRTVEARVRSVRRTAADIWDDGSLLEHSKEVRFYGSTV